MRTTFFGLEIARSALQTQQRALDVTGHNIANANTDGYTRQEAVIGAKNPYTVPGMNRPASPGQVGTGVQVEEIRRLRDGFIDIQVRTENKSLGYWEAKRDALQKVEVILSEPSDSGLRTVLDQFWEGWQELSKNPESLAVRSVVRQRGIAVAETFNHLDQLYRELQRDLNDNIKVKVQDINSIVKQIADINMQILPVEALGDKANDLRDKRDLLLDKLSKIVDIGVSENSLGQVNVTIGGRALVSGKTASSLLARPNAANNGYVDVVWANDKQAASITAGEIRGLLEARGYTDPDGVFTGIIPDLRNDLDIMAKTIVDETNKLHRGGYDLNGNQNNNFFKPFESGVYPPAGTSFAQALQVDEVIVGSLNTIAAGNTPPDPGPPPKPIPGDGANALKLAQLKHLQLVDLTKGQSTLLSTWKTKQYYATQSDGLTTVPYTGATNILGGGGLFNLTDFNPNAALLLKQGDKTITINITNGSGADVLTGAGVLTVNDLVAKINGEASIQNMPLTASLVEDPPASGKFYLQVKATETGTSNVITVEEKNFKGAATFGWVNANVTGTADDFYRSQLGKLGVDSQEATRMADNQKLLVEQLEGRRAALSGVSLDEEMTNMIRFQQGYNAAARVVTVMDEMLDKIINGMGVTR